MHVNTTGSVIARWHEAKRLHRRMDHSYERLARTLRERPADDEALSRAQAQADALGKRYERACERICRAEAATLDAVLAKLECAMRCIRDIVPDGTDPEQACDIELRFVFAVERDVRRLVAEAAAQRKQPSSSRKPQKSGNYLER
jgi:hypothetical protein